MKKYDANKANVSSTWNSLSTERLREVLENYCRQSQQSRFWSWDCSDEIDSTGRVIFTTDAFSKDGRRFIVLSDDKLRRKADSIFGTRFSDSVRRMNLDTPTARQLLSMPGKRMPTYRLLR